jgi:saccharopine dehydrogenase (NAD+, L-lysine-forming)
MPVLGIIKEGKIPADNRVALTPAQCKWLLRNVPDSKIIVEPSPIRCFKDEEYARVGCIISENVSEADWLFGIKEVQIDNLIAGKNYMFFSHTKKAQPHNKKLMQVMVEKKITLLDYECLEHDDGQRMIGFGFFAGIVGAHNGMMAYGNRTGAFSLERVYKQKDYRELIHTYFGLKLPNIKIAITGSGRVAHGILEVMNLMDVQEVEPDEYLSKEFAYPVYVHLKGKDLYKHKEKRTYNRDDFHYHPEEYDCLFNEYISATDVLMNGIYWEKRIAPLFTWEELAKEDFRIQSIGDITDDEGGSVPCNLGDATIEDPIYGVDKLTRQKTEPYIDGSIDIMAVGNLPNELPRDASRYFGEQLIKYVLNDLFSGGSVVTERATILKNGKLTKEFAYLEDYAA